MRMKLHDLCNNCPNLTNTYKTLTYQPAIVRVFFYLKTSSTGLFCFEGHQMYALTQKIVQNSFKSALEGIFWVSLSMVLFNADNSSIFLTLQIYFWPCQLEWQSRHNATTQYCNFCSMWWASLGPGASHTEHGNSFTFPICSLCFAFSLLFIGWLFVQFWHYTARSAIFRISFALPSASTLGFLLLQ